jgi:plasmid stabilization system protein ParE
MVKIIWTEPALDDLRDIIEHIAIDSSVYAARFGLGIVYLPKQLQGFPKSGRIVPEFNEPGIRELLYGAYRIIYLIHPEACYIVAIIHASRDILRHLKPCEWNITD